MNKSQQLLRYSFMDDKMMTMISVVLVLFAIGIVAPVFVIGDNSTSNDYSLGEIQWSETLNISGKPATIQVIDSDMDLHSGVIDSFIIKIWSDTDINGIDLVVTETGKTTGIFEGDVFFTTVYNSYGSLLKIDNPDRVFAQYEDLTSPIHPQNKTILQDIALLGRYVIPPLNSGPAANLNISDVSGNRVEDIRIGQQVQISSDLKNNADWMQSFAYLVQIQNANDVTDSEC